MITSLFLNKPPTWQASAVTQNQEQRSSMLLPETEIQAYMELSHMSWSQENFLLFSQWTPLQVLCIIQKDYNYTFVSFPWKLVWLCFVCLGLFCFFPTWNHVIQLKLKFSIRDFLCTLTEVAYKIMWASLDYLLMWMAFCKWQMLSEYDWNSSSSALGLPNLSAEHNTIVLFVFLLVL